jgi:hypothetical protein
MKVALAGVATIDNRKERKESSEGDAKIALLFGHKEHDVPGHKITTLSVRRVPVVRFVTCNHRAGLSRQIHSESLRPLRIPSAFFAVK